MWGKEEEWEEIDPAFGLRYVSGKLLSSVNLCYLGICLCFCFCFLHPNLFLINVLEIHMDCVPVEEYKLLCTISY